MQRRGFSLVEALIALTVVGMAGAAILLATEASSVASRDALEQLIANGLANQLVDEVLGLPYKEKGQPPETWPLGVEAGEKSAPQRRVLFDDSDDYTGYTAFPIQDAWATTLGQGDGLGGMRHPSFQIRPDYFADWAVSIKVSYVDESDPSVNLAGGDTSGMRAVEVSIYRAAGGVRRELTTIRRVYSYVPPIGS